MVEEFGMKKAKLDHHVFYKWSNSKIILLVVYVDDIIFTGSDKVDIMSLKDFLQDHFQIKDFGKL